MFHKPASQSRRGIVAILVAVFLTALIGFAALSIDGGMLFLSQRRTQMTADAAAMAAGCELFYRYPESLGYDSEGRARTSALNVAKSNGYLNDGTTSTVTVNIPPSTGTYANRPGYAEVLITMYQPRFFSSIWGKGSLPVSARAVARGAWVAAKAGLIVLDYDDRASFDTSGNGRFKIEGSGVIVNSNNPDATITTGGGYIEAPVFDLTGGLKISGSARLIGTVNMGTHPTPDPLAYLPQPSVPSDGTMTVTTLAGGGKQYTLTPGRYTNLPVFSMSDKVILKQASAGNSGIYFIDGGGFQSTGANITMDPSTSGGVLLYNRPANDTESQKINITGNPDGTVRLSPLTTGPYKNMVIWQDRTKSVDIYISGNGNFVIDGTIYAALADVQMVGNGTGLAGSTVGSQIITKNLTFSGNGDLFVKYSENSAAKTRIIALVE